MLLIACRLSNFSADEQIACHTVQPNEKARGDQESITQCYLKNPRKNAWLFFAATHLQALECHPGHANVQLPKHDSANPQTLLPEICRKSLIASSHEMGL